MFKTISIANIQSHTETSLDLSPGVNVVTGQSDSGKTGIIRSLFWLINNRPSGETLRNWNSDISDPMAVEVVLSEGGSIAINREKGKTSYMLSYKGQEESFQAIKTDVPSEVSEVLNLSSYNLQSQHQTYFLLQDTPGEVARTLNELTGLSIIDSAFKKVSAKIRETTSKIESLKSDRDRGKEQLKQYDNLDSIRILIEDIERDTKELSKIEVDRVKIINSITELLKIKERLAEQQSLLETTDEVTDILALISEQEGIVSQKMKIQYLLNSLSSLKEDQEQDTSWLEMEPSYTEISNLLKEYEPIFYGKFSLASLLSLFDKNSIEKNKVDVVLQTTIGKYVSLLDESKICPTCGTPTSKKMLEEIKTRL